MDIRLIMSLLAILIVEIYVFVGFAKYVNAKESDYSRGFGVLAGILHIVIITIFTFVIINLIMTVNEIRKVNKIERYIPIIDTLYKKITQ